MCHLESLPLGVIHPAVEAHGPGLTGEFPLRLFELRDAALCVFVDGPAPLPTGADPRPPDLVSCDHPNQTGPTCPRCLLTGI